MAPATFIPLSLLHPRPAAASSASTRTAPMHRAYSDPLMGLPTMNKEWDDVPSRQSFDFKPVPAAPHHEDMVLVSTLLLDHKITNLEERLKTAMGPWALYGLRYATLVGLGTATVVKIALVVLSGVLPLSPLVGLGIFLGVLVGSIAIGLIVQTATRRKFVKSGQSQAFLQEIKAHQQELMDLGKLSGTQVKSLRRLQILAADIDGGIKHSLWSIIYGITGFDPQLSRMMRKAHDVPEPAQKIKSSTKLFDKLRPKANLAKRRMSVA